MKIADIPVKFNIPFAASAGGGYTIQVPQASQIGITNGAASLTDGFPPLTFLPVGAGGVPPWGRDFNGILNQVTKWSQWGAAGGTPLYDAAFSTAIGGYPKGAILQSTTAGLAWLNKIDDNTSNPDSGGSNWIPIVTAQNLQSGAYLYAVGAGTNTITGTLAPAITAYVAGMKVDVLIANANTGATTLNLNGVGAAPVITTSGIALIANQLRAGQTATFVYNGTSWQLTNPGGVITQSRFALLSNTAYFQDSGAGGIAVFVANAEIGRLTASGFLIGLTGPGTTTDGATIFQDGLIQHSKTSNIVHQVNRNGTNGLATQWLKAGVDAGSVQLTGATAAFVTSSDRRLKANERDFDSGAIIDATEAWEFDWTYEGADGHIGYGVIAQDANKVYPTAVAPAPEDEPERNWGVDYAKYVPVLLSEMKKMRAREQTLLARLAKLEKAAK